MNRDIDDIKNFIYLDTNNYISLDSLKIFYWAIIIIPFMMVVMGIVGKSLFALVFVTAWSLIYWIFVLLIQSRYVKKTFELRFVVNGITGLLISSLVWGFYATFNITSETSTLTLDYFIELIMFYIGVTLLYTIIIIFGIHTGMYSKFKKRRSGAFSFVTRMLSIILPSAGVFGMYTSRLLRDRGDLTVQSGVASLCFMLLIFLPGLANINFVQYFYCKKYKITCDESGNSISSQLVSQKPIRKHRFKDFSLPIKTFICISLIAGFALVFLLVIGILINL